MVLKRVAVRKVGTVFRAVRDFHSRQKGKSSSRWELFVDSGGLSCGGAEVVEGDLLVLLCKRNASLRIFMCGIRDLSASKSVV